MSRTRIQEFFVPNPSPITQSLLWQYGKATALQDLIFQKTNWYRTWDDEFWNQWVANVFNLTTANEFGLCVWSIILNTPLYINLGAPIDNSEIWGFNQYTDSPPALINNYWNFGGSGDGAGVQGANFSASADSFFLTVEEQRFLLRLKYFQYISRASIPQTNQNLRWLMADSVAKGLFETGNTAWVLENLNMTITYQFNFFLPTVLQLAIRQANALPDPAGVAVLAQYYNGSSYVNF